MNGKGEDRVKKINKNSNNDHLLNESSEMEIFSSRPKRIKTALEAENALYITYCTLY